MTSPVQQMPPEITRDTRPLEARTTPIPSSVPATPTPLTAQSVAFVSQPSTVPPATAGRRLNWFLRSLSVVLALGAGFTYMYAFSTVEMPGMTEDLRVFWLDALVLLGLVLWIALAAGLFRSWWAVLFVPAAFYVGALLQWPFIPSNYTVTFQTFHVLLYVVLVITMSPAVFGALLGTAISKWIEQRMRRRAPVGEPR